MKLKNTEFTKHPTDGITLKERLYKYLSNWPFFLAATLVCVGGAFLYARYTIPKYIGTTVFLVKGADNEINSSSNDLIEEALNGKRAVNLNNEMLLIGSSNLMERVVKKNDFNIGYYNIGKILNIEIYLDAPFRAEIKDTNNSSSPITFRIHNINSKGGNFSIGSKADGVPLFFNWNTPFKVGTNTFVLIPTSQTFREDKEFLVTWKPVATVAAEILSSFSITPFDTKTNAIELSLKGGNIKKIEDILNAVFKEYNLSDIEDRNKVSENTVQFIDNRLSLISDQLKNVEGNLENYQGSRQLIDIKGQSSQSLANTNDVTKTIKDLSIQRGVANIILNYFQNPENSSKLVPSSLGLNDATLTSLITQYNELQLKKEREAPLVAPNSTVMQDLNTQVTNLRSSILESLTNITKNLNFQEQNFQQQNSQYNQFLNSLPHNERVLQEIKRKQGITEGLYLYLLQKREQAAISTTSATVSHYKQIDLAKAYGPIEPNLIKSVMITTLIGLLLAISIIYVKDLLNDKVNDRRDVSNKVELPILGEINHVNKSKRTSFPIINTNKEFISEQFRAIRTNVSFVLKNKFPKVILITSTSPNEGKSFVSLNLAAVCAATGKKVALLEFDIRKPELSNKLSLQNKNGLSEYLTGEISNLEELHNVLDGTPTMHIYTSGSVPHNPTDLLLTENVSKLFDALKPKYDYIIIDSPPVGLFSDVFILNEASDLVLYIIRQRYTEKKHLEFINEIQANKKLSNIGIIINDLKKIGDNSYKYGDYNYSKK